MENNINPFKNLSDHLNLLLQTLEYNPNILKEYTLVENFSLSKLKIYTKLWDDIKKTRDILNTALEYLDKSNEININQLYYHLLVYPQLIRIFNYTIQNLLNTLHNEQYDLNNQIKDLKQNCANILGSIIAKGDVIVHKKPSRDNPDIDDKYPELEDLRKIKEIFDDIAKEDPTNFLPHVLNLSQPKDSFQEIHAKKLGEIIIQIDLLLNEMNKTLSPIICDIIGIALPNKD